MCQADGAGLYNTLNEVVRAGGVMVSGLVSGGRIVE